MTISQHVYIFNIINHIQIKKKYEHQLLSTLNPTDELFDAQQDNSSIYLSDVYSGNLLLHG